MAHLRLHIVQFLLLRFELGRSRRCRRLGFIARCLVLVSLVRGLLLGLVPRFVQRRNLCLNLRLKAIKAVGDSGGVRNVR